MLGKHEAQKVLQELHDGPAGGHFGADTKKPQNHSCWILLAHSV